MKRTLARALAVAALIAAAGASAFAQLTINGYDRVGGTFDSNANSRAFTAGNQNVLTLVDRIRLNISYAAPDDMYGFKSRLQADASFNSDGSVANPAIVNLFTDTSTSSSTTVAKGSGYATTTTTTNTWGNLKYGYGYSKFLDGVIKVSAGRLDVSDYMVTQNIGNIYLGYVFTDAPSITYGSLLSGSKSGNFNGAILQTWPIENLSLAATVRADTANTSGTTYYKPHHYGLDGYYIVPGIGKAIVASNLGYYNPSAAYVNPNSGQTINNQETLDKSFVSAGFSYTGFPGLTATAVYRYNGYVKNNAQTEYSYANGAVAIVEYSQGPLFLDLAGDFDFTNSNEYVEGEASYLIIPQIKVRGYFGYTNSTVNSSCFQKIYLNGTSLANNSLYGLDVVFPVGKAETSVGAAYADKAGLQVPLIVKVNF